MSDLFIIAAGKGSRMNSTIPKALIPIAGEPCLTSTLKQIGDRFHNIFVVTNSLAHEQWSHYFDELHLTYPDSLSRNIVNIPIESGLGDGDAVMQALSARFLLDNQIDCDIVIAWGDVFFPHSETIDELLSRPMIGAGLIPAVWESDPYVQLVTPHIDTNYGDNSFICSAAKFSKHCEHVSPGFHDQSVFRFHLEDLYASLKDLHAAFWKGDSYMTPGGELSLLHTFHHLYNKARPTVIYPTNYPTLSFNTIEEVYEIQMEINNKWKSKLNPKSHS